MCNHYLTLHRTRTRMNREDEHSLHHSDFDVLMHGLELLKPKRFHYGDKH